MAFDAQVTQAQIDERFYYEPMMAGHPGTNETMPVEFAGKQLRYPIWVSSMTGGTELARKINENLARLCNEFGFGMGLGSCRPLLESNERMADFDMRDIIGPDLPLYANLGIAQVESLLDNHRIGDIVQMLDLLRADGLIIHVNPIQEWLQPEGDRIERPPIETIREITSALDIRIIVKEVGQGIGPSSLFELLKLPLQAIEFAALGGTNFALLELLRARQHEREMYASLANIGHSAEEMAQFVNGAATDLGSACQCREIIVSGGIRGFLDGYYIMNKVNLRAIYGQASEFLKYAKEDYGVLQEFARSQVEGLNFAKAYLTVR